MSISPIANGLSTIASSTQGVHNNLRQFQQEFQQLGSDLQSGNTTAADQDYVSLHTLAGEGGDVSSGPSTPGSNPLVQQFNQLGQDLASGNISGAAQAYGSLKQDFQSIDQEHNNLRSHIHNGLQTGGQQGPADPGGLASSGLLSTGLSTVQTAYATMLQGLQGFGSEALNPALQLVSGSSGVSISA